jgi:uncharacterized protein YecE (DUF72 family)
MVEFHSTFYAAPDARMPERWCRSTPDGFTFDVKLHQLLSSAKAGQRNAFVNSFY